jgi:hypothetical protein
MPSLPAAVEGVDLLVAGLILAAATWRVSSLLTFERGPWRVFERIRERAGIKHSEFGHPNVIPDGFWPELLTCVWCCSIYVGAFWALALWLLGAAAVYLALPFALSAGALVLGKYVK